MKKYISAILILLLVAACSAPIEKMSFNKAKGVNVNVLLETFVTVPLEMEKQGKYIYVSDFHGDSLLYCYDLEDKKQARRLLPKGTGPEEFLSPVQFFLLDSILFVHNRWHFSARSYKYNIDESLLCPVGKLIKLPTDIDMIYPLSKNRMVASGRFSDSRYVIMDENGNIISRCGDYPSYNSEEKEIPNFPKFMFHQSMFGFHKQRQRLASVTSHVFELWDYSQDTLFLYKRDLLSPYKYSYNMGDGWASSITDDDTERGVERIYATDNYIYMLYNPNTEKMRRSRKDKYNSEIWIFDWDGIPIQKLELDAKIMCFCVDEYSSKIFCILNAPDPSIGEILIDSINKTKQI